VAEIVDNFLLVLEKYEELRKLGIKAPRNILLHGIPGIGIKDWYGSGKSLLFSGKSHIATCICKHSKLPYSVVNTPDLFRPGIYALLNLLN